jgi:hypothetical protein
MNFLTLPANACDMKEMIEIYHENLLLAPPDSFGNKGIRKDDSEDIFLKEQLSPKKKHQKS